MALSRSLLSGPRCRRRKVEPDHCYCRETGIQRHARLWGACASETASHASSSSPGAVAILSCRLIGAVPNSTNRKCERRFLPLKAQSFTGEAKEPHTLNFEGFGIDAPNQARFARTNRA